MSSWRDLLDELVERLQPLSPEIRAELNALVARGRLIEVAEYCRMIMGPAELGTFIAQRFGNSPEEAPETHVVMSQLPFTAMVTTNYDRLLEEAHARVHKGRLPIVVTHRDVRGTVLFDRKFFVLKAHGDVNRPDQIILTSSDYRQIIHENPAFNAVMAALLLSNAVLFVGYKMSDPDFRLLLEQQLSIFKGSVPPRYAFMSGVGEAERYVLKESAGIQVLSYPKGDHSKVLVFLQELTAQTGAELSSKTLPAKGEAVHKRRAEREDHQAVLALQIVEGSRLRSELLEGSKVVAGEMPIENLRKAQLAVLRVMDHLRGSSSGDDTGSRDFERLVSQAGHLLANALSREVRAYLAAIDPQKTIVLRLDAHSSGIPWEWTDIDDQLLFLRSPTTRVAAGLSSWARGYPVINQNPNILVIADPTGDLAGARLEAEAIVELYSRRYDSKQVRVLTGRNATFGTIAQAMKGTNFDVLHFAGHAWVRGAEPYLVLDGGAPIRTLELRALFAEAPPAIVFLNSHFTAFAPTGVLFPDTEWNALFSRETPAFAIVPQDGAQTAKRPLSPELVLGRTQWEETLEAGVGAFIGTFGDIDDEPAQQIAVSFHQRLIEGASVASALVGACRSARTAMEPTHQNLTWAFFSLAGYPELSLPHD
jgi:hypothetical protein